MKSAPAALSLLVSILLLADCALPIVESTIWPFASFRSISGFEALLIGWIPMSSLAWLWIAVALTLRGLSLLQSAQYRSSVRFALSALLLAAVCNPTPPFKSLPATGFVCWFAAMALLALGAAFCAHLEARRNPSIP